MGFNKRYFDIQQIVEAYQKDPENGITQYIGKTDVFVYTSSIAERIVEAWLKKDYDFVKNIIIEYVSGVPDKANNGV